MLDSDNPIVKEYFRKMVGDEGLNIMANVPDGEITDEEIAKLSDTKLTAVRKVLYRLYENRIAEYRTERDDNSGWITYLWCFNQDNVTKIMEEEAEVELAELCNKLEYERGGVFYQCKCQRVLFEDAVEKDFWCDECNTHFEFSDNSDLIKKLEADIAKIEKWKKKIRG